MTAEQIAEVCHEVNRAYCRSLGDYSHETWDKCPQWQRDSALAGVLFHLENDRAVPKRSHENWLEKKASEGWRYGPVKDADAKTHPCFVPFSELPVDQQAKDYIFCAVVDSLRKYVS